MGSSTAIDTVGARQFVTEEYLGIAKTLPAVSGAASFKMVMDSVTNTVQASVNGGAWTPVFSAFGPMVTLQEAYDGGWPVGSGGGRTIGTMNGGAVTMTNNGANDNSILTLGKNPALAQAGSCLVASLGPLASAAVATFGHSGAAGTPVGVLIGMTPGAAVPARALLVQVGPNSTATGYGAEYEWWSPTGCTPGGIINEYVSLAAPGNFSTHIFQHMAFTGAAATLTGTLTGIAMNLATAVVPGAIQVTGIDMTIPASTSVLTSAINVTTTQARGFGINFTSTGTGDFAILAATLGVGLAVDGGPRAILVNRTGTFAAAAVNTPFNSLAEFVESPTLNNGGGMFNLNGNMVVARREPTNTAGLLFSTTGSLFLGSYDPTGVIVETALTGLTLNMTPVTGAGDHDVRGASITMGDYTIATAWGLQIDWQNRRGCTAGIMNIVVGAARTLEAATTGILVNLNTNVTHNAQAVVGLNVQYDASSITSAALSLYNDTAASRETSPMIIFNPAATKAQGEMRLFVNDGAPANGNGADGDAYLQSDGLGSESLWRKNGAVWVRGSYQEQAVNLGNATGNPFNIDLSRGNYFYATSTGITTWTCSNIPVAGKACSFTLRLTNGGANAQTWMADVHWPGGVPAVLTVAGVDILVFTTDNQGAPWYAAVVQLDTR